WFEEWQEVINGALAEEFSNPVRKLVINDVGTEKFVWEGIPDHQLHAGVYDQIAGTVLEMDAVKDYSDIGPFMSVLLHSHPPVGPESSGFDDSVMILKG